MNINFHFSKKIKYLFIIIIILLTFNFFNSNIKALVVEDSLINVSINNLDFADIWNVGTIDNLISDNYNTYVSDLREDLKNYAITQTESSDWENFTDNYYYAMVAGLNVNSSPNRVSIDLYYYSKEDNEPFNFNFNFYSSSNLTSSTSTIRAAFLPSVSTSLLNKASVQQFSNGTNYNFTSGNSSDVSWEFRKGTSGSYYTSFTYSNSQFNLYLNDYLLLTSFSTYNKFYIDSNVDNSLYYNDLNFRGSSSNYNFETMNLILNNVSTTKNLGDILFQATPNWYNGPSLMRDLGNNSYSFQNRTLVNNILNWEQDKQDISFTCPKQRLFENDYCNLNSSDWENFDTNYINFSNEFTFYVDSDFEFDSDKYYILTFRINTPYNLHIKTSLYSFVESSTYFPFDIKKVVVNDNFNFKDYQLVIKPTHNGIGYLDTFTIVFDEIFNYTDTLDNNYIFGVNRFFKISQYDTLPSSSTISDDYNTNNISSLINSNNSDFFSSFNINDRGISQIVLLPLNFIRDFKNTSCSDLLLPLPFINYNVSLPCFSSLFNGNLIWNLYKIIINGIIFYRIIINLLKDIKNVYNPDNDNIEVIDL